MLITFNNSKLSLEPKPSISINGQKHSISMPESEILKVLIKNKNIAVKKETLIIAAWKNPDYIGVNSLPVAISNIRKIIKNDNIKIVSIPKIGYKLTYCNDLQEVHNKTKNEPPTIYESINNKKKFVFLSPAIQIIIFLMLTYFILNLIQSWVVIKTL